MAAGYLKHTSGEGIYFRGQGKIYNEMRPSLYRGIHTANARSNREKNMNAKIYEYKEKCYIFSKFGDYVAEPLLQHYGLQTTWLDIVDNIWIALWFACYEAKCTKDGHFLHFQKRIVNSKDKYAYIYLIGTDLKQDSRKKGYFRGENTELVDLRIAAPSVFLRPHAQHGLLFRCKGIEGGRVMDYSRQVRGIVRIPLEKAFDWLGNALTVGVHSLFPPAYYDSGYRILVESGVKFELPEKGIGGIHLVGA